MDRPIGSGYRYDARSRLFKFDFGSRRRRRPTSRATPLRRQTALESVNQQELPSEGPRSSMLPTVEAPADAVEQDELEKGTSQQSSPILEVMEAIPEANEDQANGSPGNNDELGRSPPLRPPAPPSAAPALANRKKKTKRPKKKWARRQRKMLVDSLGDIFKPSSAKRRPSSSSANRTLLVVGSKCRKSKSVRDGRKKVKPMELRKLEDGLTHVFWPSGIRRVSKRKRAGNLE